MAHDWFVLRDGKELGPCSAQQLKQMAAAGKLQPTSMVRRSDMQTPTKASNIKGLFAGAAPQKGIASHPQTAASVHELVNRGEQEKASLPARKATSNPTKTIVLALSVVAGSLFLCCGGLFIVGLVGSSAERRTVEKALAEGEDLWKSGDKAGAVDKYLPILDVTHLTLKDHERCLVYGRVIDYDIESGNAGAAKLLMEKALNDKITPSVNNTEAKAMLAVLVAETAKAEAQNSDDASGKKRAAKFQITEKELNQLTYEEMKARFGHPDEFYRSTLQPNLFAAAWKVSDNNYILVSGFESLSNPKDVLLAGRFLDRPRSVVENFNQEGLDKMVRELRNK